VEIRRIAVQSQPWGKSSQDPILTNGWAQWCVPVIPPVQGRTNRRIAVKASAGIKWDPISKSTNAKKGLETWLK
jgi:hypothetical protein